MLTEYTWGRGSNFSQIETQFKHDFQRLPRHLWPGVPSQQLSAGAGCLPVLWRGATSFIGFDETSELWAHQPHLMPMSSVLASWERQVLPVSAHGLFSRNRVTILGPDTVHSLQQQRHMFPYFAQDGSPNMEEQMSTQS